MSAASCEVAVIGLGPIGSTLANILGQYGIDTIILDRESQAYHLPRAVTFDDEAMRIFQSLGLHMQMSQVSEVGGSAKFVDGRGNSLVTWSRPQLRSPNGWYVNYRFHQPDLEDVLRNGFKRFGCVHEHWGCDVHDLRQNDDGVTLLYTDTNSGRERSLRAAYVVGCDGGRSFTRTAIKSSIEDLGFHEPWLVIDLLLKHPANPDASRESYHYCDPARSGTEVFVGFKRKRFEFRLNADDNPDTIGQPENVWPLVSRWIGPEQADIERTTVYTFHSVIANRWRLGRVLIAGDAAHQTPPFMGQGMCAGIRDVANLGWKLHRVLKAGASPSLLDTYQSERLPHVRAFIELTIQMGQMINRTASAIRSGVASKAEDGPQNLKQLRPTLGPGLVGGDSSLSGQLFPQPRLSSGEMLDERIGLRSALIMRPSFSSQLSVNLKARLLQRSLCVIDDASAELEDWFESNAVEAVSIRPDRYILGTAHNESQVNDLLQSEP